jgi:hypothetical protein
MELAKSFSRSLASLLEQFHPKDTVQRCPEMSEVPWYPGTFYQEPTSISSADSEDEDILYFHHLSSLRFHRIPSSKCLQSTCPERI